MTITHISPREAELERGVAELKAKLAEYEKREPVAWMMVNNTHEACGKVLMWKPAEDWHITWEAVPLYLGVKNE